MWKAIEKYAIVAVEVRTGTMAPVPSLFQTRRLKGYSQEALAVATGLSVATIADIERGDTKRPHPSTISRIASVLQVDAATITEFSDGGSGSDASPSSTAAR